MRIAWTLALPGLPEFSNSTPAWFASAAGVLPIHCLNTSVTSAAWPGPLAAGRSAPGSPVRVTSCDDPV